jgi:hypothetical protein
MPPCGSAFDGQKEEEVVEAWIPGKYLFLVRCVLVLAYLDPYCISNYIRHATIVGSKESGDRSQREGRRQAKGPRHDGFLFSHWLQRGPQQSSYKGGTLTEIIKIHID